MNTKTDKLAKAVDEKLNIQMSIAGIAAVLAGVIVRSFLMIDVDTFNGEWAVNMVFLFAFFVGLVALWFTSGKANSSHKRDSIDITSMKNKLDSKFITAKLEDSVVELKSMVKMAMMWCEATEIAEKHKIFVPEAPEKKTKEVKSNE